MTDTDLEQNIAEKTSARVEEMAIQPSVPAEEEQLYIPQFVKLGNLIPEIKAMLGPEEKNFEKPQKRRRFDTP